MVFGTIGWWGGQGLTKENMNFVSGIEAAALKAGGRASAKVLLVCQTGLRSEVAAQRLLAMGFGQVAYVVGGLNEARLRSSSMHQPVHAHAADRCANSEAGGCAATGRLTLTV